VSNTHAVNKSTTGVGGLFDPLFYQPETRKISIMTLKVYEYTAFN